MPHRLVKLDKLLQEFKKEEFMAAEFPSHYATRDWNKWKKEHWKFANGKKLSIFYQKTTVETKIMEYIIIGKEDVAIYWYMDSFTFFDNKPVFSSVEYNRSSPYSIEWQKIQKKLLEKIRELFIENN
jgi:hypothetical protein